MMRLTLLSAAAISAVHASVSTSVFPNSLCQGASDSLGGLVGVGKVTLANGDVEVHCGCPSDNLADFEACPSSATGESVCNSVYDMSTGEFSASCGVIACSGADCLNTIVNEVVTHEDECFNSDRGSIGIATVNGEASCGCSSEVDAADFTACAAPANGKATCTTTDPDFLGAAYDHAVQVECGVVCDEGFVLAPGGACTKVVKRDMMPIGAPAPINYASTSAHNGGSSSWHYGSSTAAPTTTSYHPHQAHPTSGAGSSSATTTSYSYKYHHGHSSSSSWVAPSGTQVPWVSRTSPSAGGHSSSSSASWMSYSTMPAPPTSSGVNHNAHPTTTGDASSSSTMMPTTTSYSYNQWNGHSSNSHPNGGSASASASMMHWAHYNKRDAVPTAAPAYVYKQHNARAPANHHRRSSSGSPSASIPWGHHESHSHSASIPWGHHESHSHSGSASSWVPSSSGGYGGSMMPTTTPGGSNHYAHTTTTAPAEETTTSYSYKYHHHQSSSPSGGNGGSSSSSGGMASSSSMMNWVPAPSMGPSGSNHNAHNPSDSSSSTTTTGAVVPTTTTTGGMMYGSTTATPGPSQRAARRAADEFVFSDVCAQDERTCPGDDIMCVRLDDVTQCGGCHATGDAVNCLEIPGASSVSCLRGGCVVRSCQTGYFQTAEGRCERL